MDSFSSSSSFFHFYQLNIFSEVEAHNSTPENKNAMVLPFIQFI
jgi:hypothetical protein